MTPHDLDIDDDSPTIAFRPDLEGLRVPPPPPRRMAPIPPPLPVALRKRIAFGDEDWLASLPAESRAVLEAAAMPARPWPYAERIPGAVCTPIE